MKKNKALKRLRKVETMISDLAKRYVPEEPDVRELLQDAKAAVTRAKEAASVQASAATGSKHRTAGGKPDANGRRESPGRKKAAEPKVQPAAKRAASRTKTAAKKAAVVPVATTKKSAPKKRTARIRVVTNTTPAPAQPAT
jgi:hypothetical protein